MKQYLFETHVHTSEVSLCAEQSAEDMVNAYMKTGYDGIILTDHMSKHTFEHMPQTSWEEKVTHFLEGFRAAKSAAKGDFVVLLGMEITFVGVGNDYLVYGIDEDFLFKHEDIYEMDIKRFHMIAKENGFLVFQAHPFRKDMQIVNPELLDGFEIYNGNSHHDSNNEIAELWAKKHNLLPISGSDYHGEWGMEPGGIFFSRPICTNSELLAALRSHDYLLR